MGPNTPTLDPGRIPLGRDRGTGREVALARHSVAGCGKVRKNQSLPQNVGFHSLVLHPGSPIHPPLDSLRGTWTRLQVLYHSWDMA